MIVVALVFPAVFVAAWWLLLRHLERESVRHAAERHELYVRLQTPELAPSLAFSPPDEAEPQLFVEFDNDEQYHDATRGPQ